MARDKKPPAFQFYAADWLSDGNVMCMSLAEQGAYIRLLSFQWNEGYIPTDPKLIRRILGCSEKQARAVWPAMLKVFMPDPDQADRLINGRLLEVKSRLSEYRSLKQQVALNGWKLRKSNDAHALHVEYKKDALRSPISEIHPREEKKEIKTNSSGISTSATGPVFFESDSEKPIAKTNAVNFGQGVFPRAWYAVAKTALTDAYATAQAWELCKQSFSLAELPEDFGVEAYVNALLNEFLDFRDRLRRDKLGVPPLSITGFAKHFSSCEESVRLRLKAKIVNLPRKNEDATKSMGPQR